MLRFLTSGESHGPMLVAILDGLPSGLEIDLNTVNAELARRQQGYGRGARQKIESDTVELAGGVRHGTTTGAPLSLIVKNRDWDNWQHVMSVSAVNADDSKVREQLEKKAIGRFRPGHADLAGTFKFRQRDIRDVLERASARETAARVAVGAMCQQLLAQAGVRLTSHVIRIRDVSAPPVDENIELGKLDQAVRNSEMFCHDAETTEQMKAAVKVAWQDGDSLGGVIEVLCDGLPIGLGSYTQWDERLDGQLAQAVISIQAMKAVEVGDGVTASALPGSQVHDALFPQDERQDLAMGRDFAVAGAPLPFRRSTNRAGGIEGGMTNGSRLRLRAYMKPIPTIRKGLPSLSFPELHGETAHYERSDVCAVPAASVVVKAMVSFVLARSMLLKFGGDSMYDFRRALAEYRNFCTAPSFDLKGDAFAAVKMPEMELE